METWPGENEDGLLSDAHERITTAEEQIEELSARLVDSHKSMVRMMLRRGASRVVTLPPARLAGRVPKRIQLLCGTITEHLRGALDYGIREVVTNRVRELSEREKRKLKFPIYLKKADFDRESSRSLQRSPSDLRRWLERLQPFRGNEVLRFVKTLSNDSKHRRLPKVQNASPLKIVMVDAADPRVRQANEPGSVWWVFPGDETHKFLVKRAPVILPIDRKHDALVVLPICARQVRWITNTFERCLQEGRIPDDAFEGL